MARKGFVGERYGVGEIGRGIWRGKDKGRGIWRGRDLLERDMAWERCREGNMARVRCTSWRERDMA